MAAPFLSKVTGLCQGLSKSLGNGFLQNQSVRYASKKAGGSTRNRRRSTPGKHRGFKKGDGDYVEKGMILYRQLGLRAYPGENVGIGKDLTLVALERGNVMVTSEKLNPYPDSPLYPAVHAGRILYKRFYHVVPETQEQTFKLVSQT